MMDIETYSYQLFGEKATEFLIYCYLGIGRTEIRPVEEYERKSVGTERTFADLWGSNKLRERMKLTAEDLEKVSSIPSRCPSHIAKQFCT